MTPQFRWGICEKVVMWDGSTDISELFSLKLRINSPKCVSFIAVLDTTSDEVSGDGRFKAVVLGSAIKETACAW